MDPNQLPDQKNQDLMLPPEDSLMEITPKPLLPPQEEVSYTPPQAWGDSPTTPSPTFLETPREPSPLETNPPLITPPLPTPPTPEAPSSSPAARTFLVGIALTLLGILLGVLASFFLPAFSLTAPATPAVITPTPTIITPLPTMEITPIPVPTATPSALLNLKWNMMTVKSPVSSFNSYRIYYPTTWSVKESKNTSTSSSLILTKGNSSISITQGEGTAGLCLFPGDAETDGQFSKYGDFRSIVKNSLIWHWAMMETTSPTPIYQVCEQKPDNTSVAITAIGNITLNTTDSQTIEEFNYILEKISIIK